MKIPCLSGLKGEFFEELIFRLFVLEEEYCEDFSRPEGEVIKELELMLKRGYARLGINSAESSELTRMKISGGYEEDRRIYWLLRRCGDNKQEILSNLREHFRNCKRCRENYESFLEEEMVDGNLDVGDENMPEYHDICYYDKKYLGLNG